MNKGNLALKYKVAITGINGSAKLNEVIDWTINDADINLTEMQLKAGEEGAAFTIKGHMQESAGNDYMNESIDGIAITVYATQDTVEYDSFNNTYDENATYPVVNVTELKEALTNGGIDTGVNGGYGINVKDGATLTINGGYYYGGGTAVQVQEGTLIINGGTFACEPFGDLYGYNFLINCVDSAYRMVRRRSSFRVVHLSTSTPPTTPLRVPAQLRGRWLQGRASDSDQRRHLVYCGC